ncbi:MAG: transcriptional repressor LexA [Clostridia bacterium]|nr:transcriptional repressor LexA [Clostridia bacterium]
MQQPLTDKEKRVYEYIADTINSEGYPPSVRDIQLALHIKSTSTVHAYLARLEDKGYIRREKGKSRSMRVDEPSSSHKEGGATLAKVPILGVIAAGNPILATETYNEYLDFHLPNPGLYGQLYALRISGTSMIGAGIMDGDIVVVNKCSTAENGDIVVALLEDEATLKRFYKEDGRFRLQPENPDMAPIYTDSVSVLGKVVAVVRYYH